MKDNIEDKNANQLINDLIQKINEYSGKLQDKIKVDSIFREFDSYAHSNFQNFIKMSDDRYKSVKGGNNIGTILSKQSKKYKEITQDILSNNLYKDSNVGEGCKKLYKKSDKKEDKEIYSIRKNILEKVKNLTAKEALRREKLAKAGRLANKSAQKLKSSMMKNTSRLEWGFAPKSSSQTMYSIPNNLSEKNVGIFRKTSTKIGLKDKDKDFKNFDYSNYFDNMIAKDSQNINQNLVCYKEYLHDVEKNKEKDLNKIIKSGENFGHNYSFKINDVKLLSYKEEEKQETKNKNNNDDDIDIIKLVRYTKRENKKWLEDNIRLKSIKRQNSIKKNIQRKKATSAININNNKILKKIKIDDNNKTNKDEYNSFNNGTDIMDRANRTTFNNFKNTLQTVKNEAEIVKYMNINFDSKRQTMEGFFKRNTLPQINEYDLMFKTRDFLRKKKLKNKNLDENFLGGQTKNKEKDFSMSNKYQLKFVNQNILERLRSTYKIKKQKWDKEDEKKEKKKLERRKAIENTKKYLKKLKKFPRKPQLYSDPYSKMDNVVNNQIKFFIRSLSGPFYVKGKIENKLNDFFNYLEKNEPKTKRMERKSIKNLKEEENKKREEEEQMEIINKMKETLAKEKENELGKINLNFKFRSSLKVKKTEDKDAPYRDYKEFYQIVKNKEINKETYDNSNKNVEDKKNVEIFDMNNF